MTDDETEDEMLDRVRAMADGGETWDLSPRDLAALRHVLDERDAALRRAEEAEAERDRLRDEVEALRERVEQYEEDARKVLAEECAPDERHCACVPALRAEVARVRREALYDAELWLIAEADDLLSKARDHEAALDEKSRRLLFYAQSTVRALSEQIVRALIDKETP